MRLPTTKTTPTFKVGDFVAFEQEVSSTGLKGTGFDSVVFEIVAFDGTTLKYRAANRANDESIYLAGSFFRKLTDKEVLRYRLTGGL